jgi:hypothetical protein
MKNRDKYNLRENNNIKREQVPGIMYIVKVVTQPNPIILLLAQQPFYFIEFTTFQFICRLLQHTASIFVQFVAANKVLAFIA